MRPIYRQRSQDRNLVTHLNGEAQCEDKSPCHLREVRPGAHTPEEHELVGRFREDCRVSKKRRRRIDLLAYTTSTTIAASTALISALSADRRSVQLTFGKKYSHGKRKKIERMMIALVMIAAICDRAPVKPFSRDPENQSEHQHDLQVSGTYA